MDKWPSSHIRAIKGWTWHVVCSFVTTTADQLVQEAPTVTAGGGSALFGWAIGRDSQLTAVAAPHPGFWSVWSIISTIVLVGGTLLWLRRARLERARKTAERASEAEDRRLLREVHEQVMKTGAVTTSGIALTAASVGATGAGGPLHVVGPMGSRGIAGVYGIIDPVFPPLPHIYGQRDDENDQGSER